MAGLGKNFENLSHNPPSTLYGLVRIGIGAKSNGTCLIPRLSQRYPEQRRGIRLHEELGLEIQARRQVMESMRRPCIAVDTAMFASRTIARQTESEKARGVIDTVHGGVLEGRSLAEAMQREAKSFPQLYRAMVSAGEGAGSLPVILDRLADLQERQAQVRSKLFAALAYPLVLALVAMFVVGALMIYVVPKVVEQFDTVGQQLPLLTRVVIGVSGLLAGWWWAMLLVVGGLSFLCWRMLQDPARRLAFDLRLLRLPLIGRLIRDLHAARLARTLSTMVASRLPLIEGLALTSRTVRNHALRQASEQMVEAIRGGGSLSAALRRTGLFPPLLVYLTASGESSGQLDTMLERAADYLEREFDSFTAAALAMLEPAIIVVMGAIVAAIVLSILLPILQLESLAGV